MSLADAFAPIEQEYRNQVLAATWGHLAPGENKTYRGYIVFTWAAYGGDLVIIDSQWNGLDDSPWLYEAMQDFVFGKSCADVGLVEGGIYKFEGTVRNYRFKGKRTALYLPPSAPQ